MRRYLPVLLLAGLLTVLGACSKPEKTKLTADQDTQTSQSDTPAAPFSNDQTASSAKNQAQPEAQSDSQQDSQPEKKSFFGDGSKPSAVATIIVPAGTVLNVRLQSTVSSASAQSGDSFQAVLDEPIVVNGQTIAPRGAQVVGRVVEAKSSGHLHDSGYLRLTLASIEVHGRDVSIETSSLFAKGANHNKRNTALIGGGTGAGALIGGLAGGGKGALIGGLLGAGAGTGGAYATGKKDVAFGAERRLSFRLTQPFTTKS